MLTDPGSQLGNDSRLLALMSVIFFFLVVVVVVATPLFSPSGSNGAKQIRTHQQNVKGEFLIRQINAFSLQFLRHVVT